ncbi:hypothetical protein ACG5V6_24905 [Streptomyces chitinivorans]|uniref:Uncharacterized protein n=1 Tax=Streptomyces chitinivorans TaxID=1257027 RepID=A0ABW7I0C9_9ACTN
MALRGLRGGWGLRGRVALRLPLCGLPLCGVPLLGLPLCGLPLCGGGCGLGGR